MKFCTIYFSFGRELKSKSSRDENWSDNLDLLTVKLQIIVLKLESSKCRRFLQQQPISLNLIHL